jgi:response regulator RpfG family c-di-GMP phosphodiesterase
MAASEGFYEGLTVICVDDEKMILDTLQRDLSPLLDEKMQLEFAESAEEALEIMEEIKEEGGSLAVVVSDQIMPGMKGHELMIDVYSRYPFVQKILLTGQADADAVGTAVNKAALYRYIAKPWQTDDLLLTVKEAAKKFVLARQVSEQEKLINNMEANVIENITTNEKIELENDELLKKIMFQRFLHFLTSQEKNWLINAAIGLICVDRKITKTEMIYVQAIVSENREKEFVYKIVKMIETRTVPKLEQVSQFSVKPAELLNRLLDLVILEGKLSDAERKYILYASEKIGFMQETVIGFLDVALQQIELNKKKQSLVGGVKNAALFG